MAKIYLLYFLLLLSTIIQAQSKNITITLTNSTLQPIPAANISINSLKDTTIILQQITTDIGVATFQVNTLGKYTLVITSIGYQSIKKVIEISNSTTNIPIQLKPQIVNKNKAITVVAKKPLITQEDDKTIVDPENLVQTSTNAFEVLEKTPGIFADQDGNFYLSSTTPAIVQINGRDLRLGAADMASLIKSLPPNAILKIEIVRTPSAKEDASGSGGVINIVLRKGVKLGLTGSVFGGGNQGTYGNQFVGASISNNTDKRTIYVYTGLSRRANYDAINSNRFIKADSLLQQQSYSKTNGYNPYLNFGTSYMPNKKWEFGYDLNFSYNKSNGNSTNVNNFTKKSTNTNFANDYNTVANDGGTYNIAQNINAKLKTDSNKIVWTSSVSFNYFKYNNSQNYNTQYTSPNAFTIAGNGKQNSNRYLTILQTDVVWKPIKKLTLEAGIKSSTIQYKNEAQFFKNNNTDNLRSNKFDYTESITATYLQASKTVEKFVLKTGIRLENTNMQGTQLVPSTQKFTINRNDFFPYVYLSRPIATIMKYDLRGYLVYRKSITRPGYDLLNPFSKFIDNYLSEVGNPNLKPQFTETVEANISFEDQPIFAIGQNKTKGIFTNVIYQNPNNPQEALRTYDNLGNNTENYLRFTAALPPGGKYFFVVGGQRNFNKYNGFYEGKPLQFNNTSWNFFTYHQLKLDKRSSLSMQGWMQTGGLFQFYQLSNFGQLNFSINRQFLNKKLIVTLNLRDALYTNQNEFTLQQGSINAFGNRNSDTRRFGINLRYNFGIKKKEEQQNYNGTEGN